jgi:hypothetical protein
MTPHSYSRRTFFKATGLAVGALLLAQGSAQGTGSYVIAHTEAFGKRYHGTRDGRVFESVDDGKTWQQVACFGSHCAVQALQERRGRLQAQVGVAGYGFALTSSDAREWRTA